MSGMKTLLILTAMVLFSMVVAMSPNGPWGVAEDLGCLAAIVWTCRALW